MQMFQCVSILDLYCDDTAKDSNYKLLVTFFCHIATVHIHFIEETNPTNYAVLCDTLLFTYLVSAAWDSDTQRNDPCELPADSQSEIRRCDSILTFPFG